LYGTLIIATGPFGYIEGAAVHVGIIGIIELETNVEAIGRRQTGIRI